MIIARRIKFEIYIGSNGVVLLNKLSQKEANIIKAAFINEIQNDQLDIFIRDQLLEQDVNF